MIIRRDIYKICSNIRQSLVLNYDTKLEGKCIEASHLTLEECLNNNIDGHIIHGYFHKINNNSEDLYLPHTWVELYTNVETLFVDVTLTQFQPYFEVPIPTILIGSKPKFLTTINLKDENFPEEFF